MLILSRKYNERVVIDVPASDQPTRIEVVVVDIDRGKTRLGIHAARDVLILRKELLRLGGDGGEAPAGA